MRVRAIACPAMCLLFAFAPAAAQVSRVVVNDRNGNGQWEAGEPGVARVVVSNQVDAVATDSSGTFRLGGPGTGISFVSVPDGSRATTRFWQRADTPAIVEQTGAVVGPAGMPWFPMASGITIYIIRGGRLSDGTFVRLDPVPMAR
jgi:hypothetical protein